MLGSQCQGKRDQAAFQLQSAEWRGAESVYSDAEVQRAHDAAIQMAR